MDIDFILNGSKSKKRKAGKDPLMDLFSMKSSQGIIGDIITKPQRRVLKTKTIKTMFGDWDGDGVINGLDCQPRNKNKHRANKMIRDRLKKVNFDIDNGQTPGDSLNNPNFKRRGYSFSVNNINSPKGKLIQNAVKKSPELLSHLERSFHRRGVGRPSIYIENSNTPEEASFNGYTSSIALNQKWQELDPEKRAEIMHHELRHHDQWKTEDTKDDWIYKYQDQSVKYGYKDNSFEKDARRHSYLKFAQKKYSNLPDYFKDDYIKAKEKAFQHVFKNIIKEMPHYKK